MVSIAATLDFRFSFDAVKGRSQQDDFNSHIIYFKVALERVFTISMSTKPNRGDNCEGNDNEYLITFRSRVSFLHPPRMT